MTPFYSGVSILDEWHVITAAHCVDDGSGIAGITKEKGPGSSVCYDSFFNITKNVLELIKEVFIKYIKQLA